jgi:hypothetical protein
MLGPDPYLLEDLASAYRANGELRKAAVALVEAVAVDASRAQRTSRLVDLYGTMIPRVAP